MYILGFDVSKHELVCVLINKRGSIKGNWKIRNEKEHICSFLNEILDRYTKVVAGCEATGEYHNVLAKSCIDVSIPFYVLNPIVTKQFTRATVRKKKTDLTDAHIIAKCILQGEGYLIREEDFNNIKPLLRTASQLGGIKKSVGQVNKRFEEHYPELDVKDVFEDICESINKGVKQLNRLAIEQIDNDICELLCSISGIGKTLAPVFIAEIGDIHRFKSIKSLIAFSGLDPKIRQSGIALNRNTKITKRGSPYLRRAAFIAASIAQRHDPVLKEYYDKKRNEGKRYREATIANARHILARIYAVWKRGTPYIQIEKQEQIHSFPQSKVLT